MAEMPLTVVRRYIEIKGSFVALHRWPDAPEKGTYSGCYSAFLREEHRHRFGVVVCYEVGHGDRELEFFDLRALLRRVLEEYEGSRTAMSCEMFAENIGIKLADRGRAPHSVSVSEDGENEAVVVFAHVSGT